MTNREFYEISPLKANKWLEDLLSFTKHSEIDIDDLKHSALIVIDMQNFFLNESSHAYIPSAGAIVPNINDLIKAYSEHNHPVIFTRHALAEGEDPGVMARWWKDTLIDGTDEAELWKELKVPENADVIRKTTYNAFHKSELRKILVENKVKTLVITGVITHLCCETTARAAFVNNYYVYFVIDGTAAMNEELHLSAVRTLADGFAVPCTTQQLSHSLTLLPSRSPKIGGTDSD